MQQMFGGDAPHPQDAGELFAALESTEGVNTDAETEIDAVTQSTVGFGAFAVARAILQQQLQLPGTIVCNDDGTSYVNVSHNNFSARQLAAAVAPPAVPAAQAVHLNSASILLPLAENSYEAVARGEAPYWSSSATRIPVQYTESALKVHTDVCCVYGCDQHRSTFHRSFVCEHHDRQCAHVHPLIVRVPSSRSTSAPLTTQLSCTPAHVTRHAHMKAEGRCPQGGVHFFDVTPTQTHTHACRGSRPSHVRVIAGSYAHGSCWRAANRLSDALRVFGSCCRFCTWCRAKGAASTSKRCRRWRMRWACLASSAP